MKSENRTGQRRKRAGAEEQDEKPKQKKPAGSGASGAKKKKGGAKKGSKGQKSSKWLNWVKFSAAVLGILIIAGVYLFDISRVSSNAMMPNLAKGDLVLSFAPKWVNLNMEAGDIVLVDNSDNEVGPNFLRAMDFGGREIGYSADRISIDGRLLERLELTNSAIVRPPEEPEIWRETLPNGRSYRIMLPQHAIVGAISGQYKGKGAFLAGDNRMASYDSRQAGPYERGQILGRALFILETTRNDGLLGSWIKGTGN